MFTEKGSMSGTKHERIRYVVAWVAVYFCRVSMIVNGIIYTRGGASYIQSSRDTLDAWPNVTTFSELQPVLKDEFISSQMGGIVILAPFMGAAYTCIGVTSIVACFTFADFEAAVTLFLQASLLSLIGCLIRPSQPEEFYKPGMQDSVQQSQLIGATIVAYISLVTFVVPFMLGYKIPSPREYAWQVYGKLRSDQSQLEPVMNSIHVAKASAAEVEISAGAAAAGQPNAPEVVG